jgi:hypothetical protein
MVWSASSPRRSRVCSKSFSAYLNHNQTDLVVGLTLYGSGWGSARRTRPRISLEKEFVNGIGISNLPWGGSAWIQRASAFIGAGVLGRSPAMEGYKLPPAIS